jgi:filamin
MIGGTEVKCTCTKSKKEEGVYECVYVPIKQGQYIINITFGDQHIAKSPFKVEVGPAKTSKIRAYGPGLEGGVVNQPARFTVETQGETGALGRLIQILIYVGVGGEKLSICDEQSFKVIHLQIVIIIQY